MTLSNVFFAQLFKKTKNKCLLILIMITIKAHEKKIVFKSV